MMEENSRYMDYQKLLEYQVTWMVIGIIIMSVVMYFAQGIIVLFGGIVLGLYLYQNVIPTKKQHDIDIKDYVKPNMVNQLWEKISDKLGEGFQNKQEEKNKGWRWWHTP